MEYSADQHPDHQIARWMAVMMVDDFNVDELPANHFLFWRQK
ncbi:hypothetical protein [Nitrosomonas ureae]|nr:hypothetical protein [Nitrosomonas ureae]